MSIKPIRCLLFFLTFSLSHAAMAQDSSAIEEQLAMVNAKIEALTQENLELKDRITEAQNEIDELKRISEQKDEELNLLRQQTSSSEE